MNTLNVRRGEIYLVDFTGLELVGSEQAGVRPALIVQNNVGNKYSPNTLVATITSSYTKKDIPTHVNIDNLHKPSIVLCEQVFTVSKGRIMKKIGALSDATMLEVDKAMSISLGIAKEW